MTTVTFPRPRVVLLSEDVALELDDTTRLLVTTTATADALIAALHQARDLIEQQQRARAERADRAAGRELNRSNEAAHSRYGSTLPGFAAPPTIPVDAVVIEAARRDARFACTRSDCGGAYGLHLPSCPTCECSRFFVCDKHVQGGAA